jgi:molybdenum cofactor cytidylyltransferase
VSGIAAIILAAGLGSRFGGPSKPLALFRGRPMLAHALDAAAAARTDPVIVVTGHAQEAVRRVCEAAFGPVRLVENPDYASGLASSLKAGFAALPHDAAGAVILLADMPLVSADVIDRLVAAFEDDPQASAVIPVNEGRRGNPVLLSARLADAIMQLEGDRGAGQILRNRDDICEVPVADVAVLADVDTPEALAGIERDHRG